MGTGHGGITQVTPHILIVRFYRRNNSALTKQFPCHTPLL